MDKKIRMRNICCLVFVCLLANYSRGQSSLGQLTVEKIMRDPTWIGSSPSSPLWSTDGKTLYFNWNPEKSIADSLYAITINNKTPVKATVQEKQTMVTDNALTYNKTRTAYVYSKDGDIFYRDSKTGKTKRLTETTDNETNPQFSFGDSRIVFIRNLNLYAWDIATGETQQLTNIRVSSVKASGDPDTSSKITLQEAWLKKDQLHYFEVLRLRKEKKISQMPIQKTQSQKNCAVLTLKTKCCRA